MMHMADEMARPEIRQPSSKRNTPARKTYLCGMNLFSAPKTSCDAAAARKLDVISHVRVSRLRRARPVGEREREGHQDG